MFGVVRGVQSGFVHLDTGVGNHLFVNDITGIAKLKYKKRYLNKLYK